MDRDWLSMDGTMTKAPLGGEKNWAQSYRSRQGGVKRSMLTEGHGVPIGAVIEGAQRHEMKLVRSTIESIIAERPKPTEAHT